MQDRELHDFLFKLYDYADHLADHIQPDGDSFRNNNYFLTLVLIEMFFDRIGRGEISEAAKLSENSELNPHESLAEAHKRIDLLRDRISNLVKEYDFDETLRYAGEKLATDWRKKQADNHDAGKTLDPPSFIDEYTKQR